MAKEWEDVFVSEINEDDLYEILNCKNNPAYFISKYVMTFNYINGQYEPIKLNKAALRMLARIHKNKKVAINAGRQSGTSTINLAYILWYSIFNRNKTTFILAYNYNIGNELLKRLKGMYDRIPNKLKSECIKNTTTNLTFINGSRIIISSTFDRSSLSKMRGWGINHLYIDGTNLIKDEVFNELLCSYIPIITCGVDTKIVFSITGKRLANLLDSLDFSICRIPWYFFQGRDANWQVIMVDRLGLNSWIKEFEVDL